MDVTQMQLCSLVVHLVEYNQNGEQADLDAARGLLNTHNPWFLRHRGY